MSIENAYNEIMRLDKTTAPPPTIISLKKKSDRDIIERLKVLRDDLKKTSQDTTNEFVISALMDDNKIKTATKTQALFSIRLFAQQRQVLPDEKFLNSMSIEQLHSELLKIWDVMKAGSHEIPIPTLVRTKHGNKSQKELSMNLCGADVTNFDTPKTTATNIPNQRLNKDENDPDTGFAAVSNACEVIMIHARIETKTTNINAREVIQSFITQLRKGDFMVQIVPVEADTF